MKIIEKNNQIIITASEGHKLTLRNSVTNNFFNSLTVPKEFDIESVVEVIDINIPVFVPMPTPELYGMDLVQLQQYLVNKSKELLVEFLTNNPIEYKGKYYSVTSDAQSHLAAVIAAAEAAVSAGVYFTPTWNTVDGIREEYDLKDLKVLFVEIQKYILSFVIQQQKIEEKIYTIADKEALLNLSISYYKE